MDSCASASAAPPAVADATELARHAASLQEEADMMQAEADAVAADPNASEEDKQAAVDAAEQAKSEAASAVAAAEAAAPAPADGAAGEDASPAVAPAAFSEDNIAILEVMAHELSVLFPCCTNGNPSPTQRRPRLQTPLMAASPRPRRLSLLTTRSNRLMTASRMRKWMWRLSQLMRSKKLRKKNCKLD